MNGKWPLPVVRRAVPPLCSRLTLQHMPQQVSAQPLPQLPPELLGIVLQHLLDGLEDQRAWRPYDILWPKPPNHLHLGTYGAYGHVPGTGPRNAAHFRRQLAVVQRLRLVCRAWRDGVRCSAVRELCLADARALVPHLRTPAFGRQFAGCTQLYLDCLGLSEVPEGLRHMPCLTSLSLARNPLDCLPPWFHTMPLRSLNLSGPADDDPGLQGDPRGALHRWLAQPSSCLPPTLQRLSLANLSLCGTPECVRHLHHLHTLDLGWSLVCDDMTDHGEFPGWFPELGRRLRGLTLYNMDTCDLPDDLRLCPLRCLSLEGGQDTKASPAEIAKLCRLLEVTPLAGALRELVLDGWRLDAVPQCLRSLRQLRLLAMNHSVDLRSLPDWLADLPLEDLGLVDTSVDALPDSFCGCASLRTVHLMSTPFSPDPFFPNPALEWDDVVAGLCQRLTAISRAQPQVRFHVSDVYLEHSHQRSYDAWWSVASGLVINGQAYDFVTLRPPPRFRECDDEPF